MKSDLFVLTTKITYANKVFMDYIKQALEGGGYHAVTPTQALIVKNIGEGKKNVGRVTTSGSYYVGTNSSYNINILVKGSYVQKDMDIDDERQSILTLKPKGLDLLKTINCAIMSHEESLSKAGVSGNDMQDAIKTLSKIEGFLTSKNR